MTGYQSSVLLINPKALPTALCSPFVLSRCIVGASVDGKCCLREQFLRMMIEDFGARVVSVWEGLRSATGKLVEKALQGSAPGPAASPQPARAEGRPYDARADWELSRLLAALDERASETGALNAEQVKELRRMADTTALVLQNQTQ